MRENMARPLFSQAEGEHPGETKEEGHSKYGTAQVDKEKHMPTPVLGPQVPIVPMQGFPILMGEVVVPLWSLGPGEARVLTTWALAQCIKVLAFLDALIIIINSVSFSQLRHHWGAAIVAFLWGPLAGFLSAQTYNPWLATVYLTYYFARLAADMLIVVRYEAWWFIVAIVCDVIIATFVARFAWLLYIARMEELEFLRHPEQARQVIAPKVSPYFLGVF